MRESLDESTDSPAFSHAASHARSRTAHSEHVITELLGVERGELDGVHAFGSDFGAAHAWIDTGAGLAVFGGTRRTASGADRPYVDEVHLLASVPLTDTRAPFVVPTRVEVGAHLAVVGASLGVDPVQ